MTDDPGYFLEVDVEYVRTETFRFAVEPDGRGMRDANGPNVIAQFTRKLNYFMHHGKSLAAGEKPRMLGFRWVSPASDFRPFEGRYYDAMGREYGGPTIVRNEEGNRTHGG